MKENGEFTITVAKVIGNIANWKIPSLQLKREIESGGSNGNTTRIDFRGVISPLRMYLYLKGRFGEPNGFQMLLKSPGSDNLIHWQYLIQSGDAYIHVTGFTFRFEFLIHNCTQPSDREKDEFLDQIAKNLNDSEHSINRFKSSLERWSVFINPYVRLADCVVNLVEELDAIDLGSEIETDEFGLPKDQSIYSEIVKTHLKAFQIGFSLKLMIPVWLESFINLLIFTLAKDELKRSSRLFEAITKQKIDVRIPTMHLFCNGFERPLTGNDPEVKEIQRLFNARNKLVHGNFEPKDLAFSEVYFDQRDIPLFDEPAMSAFDLTIKRTLKHVHPIEVLAEYKTGTGMLPV